MTTYTNFRVAATTAIERASMPTTCECCGRENLKRTLKMTNGPSVLWMGVGCAAKGTGVSTRALSKEERELQEYHDSEEAKATQRTANERFASWQSFLDARCPELRGNTFEQVRKLGPSARSEYASTLSA
jgi:hypothetical protein